MRTPADMAKELDNEDIEVKGVMLEAEEPETEPVEPEPQPEPAAEPAKEQPKASFLDTLDEEETPHPTPRVPVSALQKERQKRQEAEAKRKELEEQLAQMQQQEQEFDVSAELKGLLESDDDFVDKKVLLDFGNKLGRRVAKETRESLLQEINQRDEVRQTQAQKVQRKQQLQAFETKARETIADYDAVVQAAIETGSMTRDELQSVYRAPDPAKALYRKAKEVLNVFGIQPAPNVARKEPVNQTPNTNAPKDTEPEVYDDEALYTKLFRRE